MADTSLVALDRLLLREDGYTQELARTKPATELQTVREFLKSHLLDVAKSGDLSLIVATEKAIISGDLERYANTPVMKTSLGNALIELGTLEKQIAIVSDPKTYAAVDDAYSLKRNRDGKLPVDEGRQALKSHRTRLENAMKTRSTADEKNLVAARIKNINVAEALYKQRQAEAIGIDGTSKARGRDAGR